MESKRSLSTAPDTILDGSRFIRACLRKPVDRTPVWFLRQAGRYMQEYRDVRKHHTLVEICKQPEIAAEVTITAAEKLGVDAAIIFADLLLPLEPMGLPFEFQAGEGPVVHHPVRTAEDVRALRTDRAEDLAYVARAIQKVAAHFRDRLGIIGFCGAPFTLASYMIEGGGSKNYIHTKQMMYRDSLAWNSLLDKLITVLEGYCRLQVQAGADVIQIFDSWVGALSLTDYRAYAFAASKRLVRSVQAMGVPVIYFGVETGGLLTEMAATGADVIGLDWRQPLDDGWRAVGSSHAVQGNLDPITLFAPLDVLESRVNEILRAANGRPGHIFNLGHGIVPGTPVENVQAVVKMVRNFRLEKTAGVRSPRPLLTKFSTATRSLATALSPKSPSNKPGWWKMNSPPKASRSKSTSACATGVLTFPTWCGRCGPTELKKLRSCAWRHITLEPAWASTAARWKPKQAACESTSLQDGRAIRF
jgi:uroporphyrinogen decarboxylase